MVQGLAVGRPVVVRVRAPVVGETYEVMCRWRAWVACGLGEWWWVVGDGCAGGAEQAARAG